MGVYINGMEMPKSCDDCRIMEFEDTNCEAELYCGCPIVFKAHPQGVDHRPDYCPLVPVPPHGRLIDVDALWGEINKICDRRDAGIISDLTCLQQLLSAVRHAPTIIEAEEVE